MELILSAMVMVIVGVAIWATSKKETLIETAIANNSIVKTIREIQAERRKLRRLARRMKWAKNRLVNYPNCHAGKKFAALDILAEVCRLETKFPGSKMDLKNRALSILETVLVSGRNNREIRESAEVILNLTRIVAPVEKDEFEFTKEALPEGDKLPFIKKPFIRKPLKLAA